MELSRALIKEFAKAVTTEPDKKTETCVYGTASVRSDGIYVKLDGSDIYTPVSMATDAQTGDRVLVEIVDRSARIVQIVDKSSSDVVADRISNDGVGVFSEVRAAKEYVDTLVASDITADSIVADRAEIEDLQATKAYIKDLEAENITANNIVATTGYIKDLEAENITADNIVATTGYIKDLEAENITVENIVATTGYIKDLEAENITAKSIIADRAEIENLKTNKLDAESADVRYANIDFSNIQEAAIEKIFSDSGIIEDLIVSEGKITGELIGVTIKGDLIEAGTLKADRLVIKGSDGNYYRLNTDFTSMPGVEPVEEDSIHGSAIIAESITAEKIDIKDLVAFDATIGGFNIGDDAIYSGVKESIDNTTRGIYLDNTGQVAFGDGNNYVKYFEDGDVWRLEISAETIMFGSDSRSVGESINAAQDSAIIAQDYADIAQNAAEDAQNRLDNIQTYTHIVMSIDGGVTLAYVDFSGYIEAGTLVDGADIDSETQIRSSEYLKVNGGSNYVWNIVDSGGAAIIPTTYFYENNDGTYNYISSSSDSTITVPSGMNVYMRFTANISPEVSTDYTYELSLSGFDEMVDEQTVDIHTGSLTTLNSFMSIDATDYEWQLTDSSTLKNTQDLIDLLNASISGDLITMNLGIKTIEDITTTLNDRLYNTTNGDIPNINAGLDEAKNATKDLNDQLYNEETGDISQINKQLSYILIEPENPSITLLTTPDNGETGGKVVLTDEKISFLQDSKEGAYIGYVEGDRTSMAAAATYITEMYPRVENPQPTSEKDKWIGSLCWIARSNGHYSLKVVK